MKKFKFISGLFVSSLLITFVLSPLTVSAQDKTTIEKNTEQLRRFALFPSEQSGLQDFRVYVSNFYLFSIGASILIAVMLMMIGGVIWLTSAGNQSRVTKAQEYIINAIIGVVLLLGSYTIIQAINPRLVQLDDPNLPKIPAFGACISNTAPEKAKLKNANRSCKLVQQAECKNPDKFHDGKSCEDLCEKFVDSDGSCFIKDEKNFAGVTLKTSEGNCKQQTVLTFKASPRDASGEARQQCRKYCEENIPEGGVRCIPQTQMNSLRSDASNTHNVSCACIKPKGR